MKYKVGDLLYVKEHKAEWNKMICLVCLADPPPDKYHWEKFYIVYIDNKIRTIHERYLEPVNVV